MICRRWWIALIVSPAWALAAEEFSETAGRYHGMLLKRPESPVLLGRVVDAWLENGDLAGLGRELEGRAAAGTAEDWRVLAAFHRFRGDDESAAAALDEAVRLAPADAATRLARGRALGDLRRFDEALADLEFAARDAGHAVEAATLRGRWLVRAGRPDEAVKIWRELVEAHPQDEGLREDLVELQLGEGMTDAAVGSARELVEATADPYQRALRHLRLAGILKQAGRPDEAAEAYRRILAVAGDGSWLEREVLAQAAALFPRHGGGDAWRAFLEELREEHPQRVALKKELARSLFAAGSTDEGLAMFREVLRVLPGNREAREELVAMLQEAGRFQEAADEISSLLESAPDDAALWERLAVLRKHLDDQAGAREAVDEALALLPEDEPGAVARARMLVRFERFEEAEKILREAVAAHGKAGEAGAALPTFLVERDRREEAVDFWREMAAGADRDGLLRVAAALGSHGLGAEIFEMLEPRLADFPGDGRFLEALCEAGLWSAEPERAVPYAMDRLNRADGRAEIENALRQTLALISRSRTEVHWRKTLAEKPDKSAAEQGLLVELHERLGDRAAVGTALDALAGIDAALAASQRVRLHESRGEFAEAVAAMRRWIELPGGDTPENARRLVDLLVRADDPEAALAATERWRDLAPGDPRIWLRRADLLLLTGEAAAGVTELRRACARFGDSVELRSKLAAAQREAGMEAESRRGFLALFDETDELPEKLRWARLLAESATDSAARNELVVEFRHRARADAAGTAPLLALAEFHSIWNDPAALRDCLSEASRRTPEDVNLKFRLATAEEEAGDPDAASAVLRGLLAGPAADTARRRLAALWMRQGDLVRGLIELAAAGEGDDPRLDEELVGTLIWMDERELALGIAGRTVHAHPEDWRMAYLHAVLLDQCGLPEEAFERVLRLLEAHGELPGISPRAGQNRTALAEAAKPGEDRLAMPLFREFEKAALAHRSHGPRQTVVMQGMLRSVSVPGAVVLPDTPDEARRLALAFAVVLAKEGGARGEAMLGRIESSHFDDLHVLKRVVLLDFSSVRSLLLSGDASPAMFRWIRDGGWLDEADPTLLLHGVRELVATGPALAFTFAERWIQLDGGAGLDAATAELLLDCFPTLPLEAQADAGQIVLRFALGAGNLPPDLRDRAGVLLEEAVLASPEAMAAHRAAAVGWFVGRIRERKFDEAMDWMNRLDAALLRPELSAPQAASVSPAGQQPAREGPPEFPGILEELIPYPHRTLVATWVEPTVLSPAHHALLEALGETAPRRADGRLDIEAAADSASRLDDPVLRIGFLHASGRTEELEREIEAIEADEDAAIESLIVAAAYRGYASERWEAASALLLRAAACDDAGPWRARIDRGLLESGLLLVALGVDGPAVAEARRAALRLAEKSNLPGRKENLLGAMRELGMEDEALVFDRQPFATASPSAVAGPAGAPPNFQLMNLATMTHPATPVELETIEKLAAAGHRELAAKRMASLLRRTAALPFPPQMVQPMDRARALGLEDEIVRISAAEANFGYTRRKQHALLLSEFGRTDDALPLFRELMESRPRDLELVIAFHGAADAETRRDEIRKLAHPAFDEAALDGIFQQWIKGWKEPAPIAAVAALADFAELLEPSADPTRNLTWLNHHARAIAESWNRNRQAAGEPWQREARRLFLAMLRHPQTAEQGFRLLDGTRLSKSHAELDEAAGRAVQEGIRLRQGHVPLLAASHPDELLWARRAGRSVQPRGLPPIGKLSDVYLSTREASGTAVEVFGEDFVAALKASNEPHAPKVLACISRVDAADTSLFTEWKDRSEAPDADELLWTYRIAMARGREDLLREIETIACRELIETSRPTQPLLEILVRAVIRPADVGERSAAIHRLTTEILGPPELWPLYGEVGGDPHVPALFRRIGGFRILANVACADTASAVAMARFSAIHGLAGLASLDMHLLVPLVGRDSGNVRRLLASGLFAPGPELAAPDSHGDGPSLVASLLKRFKEPHSDPRELGLRLLKTEGQNRFWARLVGGVLAREMAPAVAELDLEAETIAAWPERCRHGLADFVLSHLPDAAGQVSPAMAAILQEHLDRRSDDPPDLLSPPPIEEAPHFRPELLDR